MSGVVRTLSRCLLPAEAGGARERRAGGGGAHDAEREARRRSRDIDAGLARERRAVRRLVKILLLGAGESGKSTFLKQMRIIHGREFDQKALLEFRDTIFDNILKVRVSPRRTPAPSCGPAASRPARPGARAAGAHPMAFAPALGGGRVRRGREGRPAPGDWSEVGAGGGAGRGVKDAPCGVASTLLPGPPLGVRSQPCSALPVSSEEWRKPGRNAARVPPCKLLGTLQTYRVERLEGTVGTHALRPPAGIRAALRHPYPRPRMVKQIRALCDFIRRYLSICVWLRGLI